MNFDITQIAESGQCFRMGKIAEGHYAVIALGAYLEVKQDDRQIYFDCLEEDFDSIWFDYFDLDRDYQFFIDQIQEGDAYLQNASTNGKGIRILKQDFWEMLITFIISQNNNIPRIKKNIEGLCERYGLFVNLGMGKQYYAFPTLESIASLSLEDLTGLGLGYRDKYILSVAKEIQNGSFDLSYLRNLNYEDASKALLSLYGVGKKVADCICLFGLDHLKAFPMDTHINAILKRHYPDGFPFHQYENYAGVLQQYMFYDELTRKP